MNINKNFFFALTGTLLSVFILSFYIDLYWYEVVAIFLLWLPYKIGKNHYSVFGGFSENSIYSLCGIVQSARCDAFQFLGISLYQSAGNDAVQFFGISLYQSARCDAFQFLGISLYQSARCETFHVVGISLYQKAKKFNNWANLQIFNKKREV
jgi:hypothetical protein